MKKLKSKILLVIIMMLIIITFFSTNVFAIDSWDFAEKGYKVLSKYSASDFYDTSIGESDSAHRQMHAQTLCSHRGANAKVGSYTQIRAVVDIVGNKATGMAIRGSSIYSDKKSGINLGSHDVYGRLAYIAAQAEQAGYLGKVGSGNNDGANLYQLAFRQCYSSGGFQSLVQEATGVSLITDTGAKAANDLYDDATEYVNNNCTLTERLANKLNNNFNAGVSAGMTCKALIIMTGTQDQQAINMICGTYVQENIDVSVKKDALYDHGVEIGDAADFKITVENKSDQAVKMDLKDTYDTNFYEYKDFTGNSVDATHSNGKITATITVPAKSKREYTATFEVKATAPINENCNNTVTISNFKVGGSSIQDKDTSDNTDSDYYYAKDYSVGINKYVYKIGGTSYSGRESNKTATIYAETGDSIVYAIKIKNTATDSSKYGSVKNIVFTDTIPSQLKDIKYWDGEEYVETLPTDWSVNNGKYTYSGSIAVNKSATLYIKGTLNTKYDTTGNVITNTATITSFKNKNNTVVYSSSVSIADCDPSSSSDSFTVKAYKASISKDVNVTYAETGDTVTYTVKVKNTGSGDAYGAIKGISLEDEFVDTEIEYKSFSGDGWSKEDDSYTFSYSGSLGTEEEATLTLKFKVIKASNTNDTITNTVNLLTVKNKNGKSFYSSTVNKMVSGSIFTDSASFKLKIYKVKITKDVDLAYVETGDRIKYTIKVKNEGSGDAYGAVKGIAFKDEFNSEELSYVKFTGSDWEKVENSYKYKYGKSIGLGEEVTITLEFDVIKMSKTNDTITNTAKITNVKNKNNIVFYSSSVNKMASGTVLTDSASSTLKIYTLNVTKTVDAVYDKAGTKLSGKTECEIGDVVEFKVQVKNAGTDNNLHGKIYEININDYYDKRYFAYDSISGTGWSLGTAETTSGNTATVKLKYTNSSGLANGSTATFKIKLKVLDNVDPTLLTDDVTLKNTAEIKSDDVVKNKNDINIRSVLNGDLKDDASLTLRSYNAKVNKYITKLNGTAIAGRDIMTVTSRNNTPVEVEKYDNLIYTFKIDNPTGAALHNITITDTLNDGLEYTSGTASVKSAKKYSDSNTSGTAITINESNTTTGSKTFNYSGSIGAGEYILIDVECKVVKTNLHLQNIENEINITEVYNRNNIEILSYIQFVSKENKEYVRLKNLVISGTVWVDKDKTGLIDNSDVKLEGIKVTLRDVTNGKYAVTYTDANGFYIFESEEPIYGTKNDGSTSTSVMIEGGENKGRVIKGTNRNDTTGNYSSSSTHIDYYVEFEYNGVTYKPTTYANQDNLKSDYSYKDNYVKDSNAIEFNPERDALNRSLETIAYNKGIHANGTKVSLEYNKSGHESDLLLNDATKINAYSFVNNPDTKVIDYLFLSNDGETEYLKYINLGLEEREVLDLQITKDLVESNVSINGYDMKYLFKKLDHSTALYFRDTDNNNTPDKYELAIYETDHKYRYDMYQHAKVQEAKGKEASELQVELVYNIVVKNNSAKATYARINEIIDTYTNEMTLNSCTVTEVPSGSKPTLTVSDSSTYNTTGDYSFSGYRTKFITGMSSIMLEKDKTFTIELRYTIDKDSSRNMYIFNQGSGKDYTDKVNVAQIGAYSTYESDKTTPKGLVDGDSNVGNLRNSTAADSYKLNNYTKYEDTAFRVDLDVVPKDDERKVTGYVFEDTRSNKLSGYNYYTGNGKYVTSDSISGEIPAYFGSAGMLRFTKQDVKDKINFNGIDANFKIALNNSDLVQDYNKDKKLSDMTVELVEIIEYEGKIYEETIDVLNSGNVIVRTATNNTGTYTLSGFIPATYVVRFKQGDIFKDGTMSYNSLTHNGQDYKSTTYTLTYDNGSNTYVLDNKSSVIADAEDYNDIKYAALAQEGLSDARGNELRRLEIMAFSEIMTNERAEELKYTHYLKRDGTIDMTKVKNFADETSYFADTVTVSLGIENKAETVDQLGEKMAYMADFSSTSLLMPNVDYGVTYRPENFLELKKSINSIKLTPVSETQPLVYIEYNEDGSVNTFASKGIHNVQSINTQGTVQGFRYINIDEDLLQGAKLEIVYRMVVNNIGEVDIITKELKDKGGASKVMAALEDKYDDVIESTTISGETRLNYSDAAKLIETVYNPLTYKYGIFVGDVYYRGTAGNTTDLDVVSITVNKILDFVDNDATFIQENNSSKNQFWATTTEEVLLNGEYKLIKEESLSDSGYFLDEQHRRYTTDNKFNLVVNVDSSEENNELVKAIVPEITDMSGDTQASIKIQVDAILGGDLESEAMVYENIAEIVQFTSPVGRRTNFAGTIGNMEVSGEVEPFDSSKEEPDSDGTEVIRLTPPTGLSRTKLFVMGNINTFLTIITVVIAIGMIYVIKTVLYGRVGKSKFYK